MPYYYVTSVEYISKNSVLLYLYILSIYVYNVIIEIYFSVLGKGKTNI